MNELKVGAALSYLSIVVNIIVGLLYTPYMLRMLGQSEYGSYSLATSVIAYLTVLDFGFGNAIVRYTSKFRAEGKIKEQEEMFGMFLLLYIGLALFTIVAGMVLIFNVETLFSAKMTMIELERTRIMLWLMLFNLGFTLPMSIWGSIMTANERFIFLRIVNIFRIVANPLVMVVLLSVGYKAITMVIITTFFNVVSLLVNYWYCYTHLHIRLRFTRFKWSFLKEVSIYSFWIFLNIIMDRIYWSSGQFVLGVYRGTVSVAIYAVAMQLTNMFMMFSTAISSVFLPKVTTMVAKGGTQKEISELFIRTGRIQYIIISFILSGFIVFGKPFVELWAGQEYKEAYFVSLLFFSVLVIPLIQNIGITILQARNQMKFRSLCYIVIALISLILSIWATKKWGLMGCTIAIAGALLLGQGVVMNIYYARRQKIDILRFWIEILRMSIAPFSVVVISLCLLKYIQIDLSNILTFVIVGVSFTALFFLGSWKFSMNDSERMLFLTALDKQRK